MLEQYLKDRRQKQEILLMTHIVLGHPHFDTSLRLVESMVQAGERRLRPIMMTALATVAGMIPLALGLGAGSQMLQPLAIAVIGGILASMVLSLVITPAVHYYLAEK